MNTSQLQMPIIEWPTIWYPHYERISPVIANLPYHERMKALTVETHEAYYQLTQHYDKIHLHHL